MEIGGNAIVFLSAFFMTVCDLNPILYESYFWDVGSKGPGSWHFTESYDSSAEPTAKQEMREAKRPAFLLKCYKWIELLSTCEISLNPEIKSD